MLPARYDTSHDAATASNTTAGLSRQKITKDDDTRRNIERRRLLGHYRTRRIKAHSRLAYFTIVLPK